MKTTTETLDKFIDSKAWWPEGVGGAKMDDLEVEAMQKEILRFPKCQMLQIGTNLGWTAFNVMSNLNKVGGFLDTIDLDIPLKPKKQKRNKRLGIPSGVGYFSGVMKKYELDWIVSYYIKGSSHFFENQCDKKYHVIFIDGDHRYKPAKRDLNNSIKRLHEGGTIFFHDVRFSKYLGGKTGSCARAFMEFDDPKFIKSIMDTEFKLGVLRTA